MSVKTGVAARERRLLRIAAFAAKRKGELGAAGLCMNNDGRKSFVFPTKKTSTRCRVCLGRNAKRISESRHAMTEYKSALQELFGGGKRRQKKGMAT